MLFLTATVCRLYHGNVLDTMHYHLYAYCVEYNAKASYTVTVLILYYYSTLKLRGSCLYWYVGFGSQLEFLGRRQKRGGGWRWWCRFNFAEFRSRSFSLSACHSAATAAAAAAAPAFCLF